MQFHEMHLKTWVYSAIFDRGCYMFWFVPFSTCTLHVTFDLFLYCRFLLRNWISLCLNDARELMVDFWGVEFFVRIDGSAENKKMLIGLFHTWKPLKNLTHSCTWGDSSHSLQCQVALLLSKQLKIKKFVANWMKFVWYNIFDI